MKKKFFFFSFIIFLLAEVLTFAMEPPTLTATTSGVNLSLSWTDVPGATGYMLVYAPYPFAGVETIQSINMGYQTGLSIDLWDGAAFYLTVTAVEGYNVSQYSNIELVQIIGISPTNESTKIVENYNITLDYDYNSDGSATQELLPLHVNKYEDVQNRLNSLKNDKEAFDTYYEWYIGNLISTQRAIDSHPSYAPRGNGKSLVVTVTNEKIDYSAYKLLGDFDANGEVDFEDEALLKEAIYQNSHDSIYDMNMDDRVDISDMINLMARIGTEIKIFDFYTVTGEKLDIPSRNFTSPRSFTYDGGEKSVMVVAKDINNVSGFESGLSDIENLWYVGEPTSRQKEGLEATSPERIAFVREALAYIKQNPEPYLLGWKISVKFRTTDSVYLELDSQGLNDMDGDSYFGTLETEIKHHFRDTTMGKETKRWLGKNRYLYHIGAGRYEKDEQVDGKYDFDLIFDSFYTHVKAFRKTIKTSKTVNGKTIFISSIAHASSVVFTSEADKTLSGFIKEDGELIQDKGKVKATRIGPDPEDVHYENELNHAEYKLENIPFGAYKIEYERGCGCVEMIDDEFIFSKNREYVDEDFDIKKKEVNVKLTVRDKDQNPLTGKNVKIKSDACLVEEKIFLGISDISGKVEFNEVPIGKYIVYIDDEESSTINFCNEYDGDIFAEQLWDIDVSFTGRYYSNEWHWKNIKIAKTQEPLKTTYDSEYPFPYMHQYGGKILVDTSFYDNTDGGLILAYYSEAYTYSNGLALIKKGYCIDLGDLIVGNEPIGMEGDTYFSCGDEAIAPTWDGIQTSLSVAQEAAYIKHEAFTVHDTGRWINDAGSSSLTITFTPAN